MFMATGAIWKCQWSIYKKPARIILNDCARLLLFIVLASKNTRCYESYKIIDVRGWGVCDCCPALRLCIGSGGGVAFTFPTQGWELVTEESWAGWGWWWVFSIFIHTVCYGPFIGRGRTYWSLSCLVSEMEGQMLVQCQSLACSPSLTAPPTPSSYITPSPSPGPLPAFIGLFISFSTFSFSPHWLLLFPPNIIPHWMLLCMSSSLCHHVHTPGLDTWMPCWILSLQSFCLVHIRMIQQVSKDPSKGEDHIV